MSTPWLENTGGIGAFVSGHEWQTKSGGSSGSFAYLRNSDAQNIDGDVRVLVRKDGAVAASKTATQSLPVSSPRSWMLRTSATGCTGGSTRLPTLSNQAATS